MRNTLISSSTDFALFRGSVGSCGKLLVDQWELSLESEVQLLIKDGGITDHLNNVHIHKSTVPDEMGLRVPRGLAGVTATLSPPNSHGDGECPWRLEKGNITPTFKKGNASPSASLPAQKFTRQILLQTTTFQTKLFWYLLPRDCLTQNYSIIAISCFLYPSSALQILLLLPPRPWNGVFLFHICNYNKHRFIYMRQKSIFHLKLGTQRCWIHSGHCVLSGVKDLLWLEVTLGMKSVVEEEHGVSMCSFVC